MQSEETREGRFVRLERSHKGGTLVLVLYGAKGTSGKETSSVRSEVTQGLGVAPDCVDPTAKGGPQGDAKVVLLPLG